MESLQSPASFARGTYPDSPYKVYYSQDCYRRYGRAGRFRRGGRRMVSQANSIRRRLFGRTLIIAALLIALLATLVTSGTALAQTDAQDPAYGTENTAPTVAPPEATVPVTTQPEPPAHACGDCGAGIGDRATEEVVEDGGAQSCGGECGVRVGKEASRGIGGRPPDGGSGAANVRYGGGSDKIDGRQAYVAALEAARSTRPPVMTRFRSRRTTLAFRPRALSALRDPRTREPRTKEPPATSPVQWEAPVAGRKPAPGAERLPQSRVASPKMGTPPRLPPERAPRTTRRLRETPRPLTICRARRSS